MATEQIGYQTEGRWNSETEWFSIGNSFDDVKHVSKMEKLRLSDLNDIAARGDVKLSIVEPEIRTLKYTRTISVKSEVFNA